MTGGRMAMSRWLGALARAGVLHHEGDAEARSSAADLVGEERLAELRAWFASVPSDVVVREQRAAIEVCIWMAHADRHVDPEERYMLRQMVASSALDEATADELIDSAHEPQPLDGIEQRITHPVLRELLLSLAWELARADGRISPEETATYDELARRLGIPVARALALRQATSTRG
jgi:tellurite resistance protein